MEGKYVLMNYKGKAKKTHKDNIAIFKTEEEARRHCDIYEMDAMICKVLHNEFNRQTLGDGLYPLLKKAFDDGKYAKEKSDIKL